MAHLEEIREKLAEKGIKQTADLDVICRFRLDDILIDVMATHPIGWASANPWFGKGFENREQINIEGVHIYIMPVPYFLVSKFTAHNDRGGNDARVSHDFEDIVYVLDNRTDWHEIVIQADVDVKEYLKQELQQILKSNNKQEAILGNLFYETQEERYKNIINKIEQALQ